MIVQNLDSVRIVNFSSSGFLQIQLEIIYFQKGALHTLPQHPLLERLVYCWHH